MPLPSHLPGLRTKRLAQRVGLVPGVSFCDSSCVFRLLFVHLQPSALNCRVCFYAQTVTIFVRSHNYHSSRRTSQHPGRHVAACGSNEGVDAVQPISRQYTACGISPLFIVDSCRQYLFHHCTIKDHRTL